MVELLEELVDLRSFAVEERGLFKENLCRASKELGFVGVGVVAEDVGFGSGSLFFKVTVHRVQPGSQRGRANYFS